MLAKLREKIRRRLAISLPLGEGCRVDIAHGLRCGSPFDRFAQLSKLDDVVLRKRADDRFAADSSRCLEPEASETTISDERVSFRMHC
jgi:hypothetical protein